MNSDNERPEGHADVDYNSIDYFAGLCEPAVKNADNAALGGRCAGPFIIGHVDEVNGEGAREIEGFIPTTYELLQLARHWASVAVDLEYFSFVYATYGSDWSRREEFARRRIARVATLLGDEVVIKIVDQAEAEFGKKCDPKVWSIFLNGSAEERKAVQNEIMEKMYADQESGQKNSNSE